MKIGDLIKVNGRLATTISENYTRMVYDNHDPDSGYTNYEDGSACSFVDVIFLESGLKMPLNLSRTNWQPT